MALVPVARFIDAQEAHIAVAFLSAHGVQATAADRFHATINPWMQNALGLRLMVRDDQAEAARSLLEHVRSGGVALEAADPVAQRPGGPVSTAATLGGMLAGGPEFALILAGATRRPSRVRVAVLIILVVALAALPVSAVLLS